jgi:hypothetical protein
MPPDHNSVIAGEDETGLAALADKHDVDATGVSSCQGYATLRAITEALLTTIPSW